MSILFASTWLVLRDRLVVVVAVFVVFAREGLSIGLVVTRLSLKWLLPPGFRMLPVVAESGLMLFATDQGTDCHLRPRPGQNNLGIQCRPHPTIFRRSFQ